MQVWAAELGLGGGSASTGQMELRLGDGPEKFSAGCVAGGRPEAAAAPNRYAIFLFIGLLG
jgi:hypothetical protein